jgi:DNA-binding transcriptional ArsR family regulator
LRGYEPTDSRLDKFRSRGVILNEMLKYQPSLDLVFQALADPTRRTMVEHLSRGPASVGELARPHAISLPAIMQHLQILTTSGLVRSEKSGRTRTCHLVPAALSPADRWIAERRTTWATRFDRLGEYLNSLPDEKH